MGIDRNQIKHQGLLRWVDEAAQMCKPDEVYWCDGSKEEYDNLMQGMVDSGAAIALKKRHNSFLFRSDPSDVARVEKRILQDSEIEAEIKKFELAIQQAKDDLQKLRERTDISLDKEGDEIFAIHQM